MTSLQFASPWFLLLLGLIPLLFVARTRILNERQQATLRYPSVTIVTSQDRSWRLMLQPLLPTLRLLAVALVAVALARPQFVDAQQIIKGQGVDIALALDISGSMASLDFEPKNRLEVSKQVIRDFIEQRPFDRIGLTVFASESFSQSPLTVDHAILGRLLSEVQLATDLQIESGTAIGLGLANAASMLKDSEAKSKVVILLTDGVNNAGQIDPITAAEAAKSLGIKVYTIGAGRSGQVPFPQTDLFGNRQVIMMESEIDEETLRQIAEMTDGLFFRAEDAEELRQIYNEINNLEKSEVEIRTFHRYTELVKWLLIPAIGLLLTELGLRHTWLRRLP